MPHYHEPAEVIKPLLDSIALQQSVDFDEIGVIICHDGEDIEDFYFINESTVKGDRDLPSYPFVIEQYNIPHGGVSAARNGALDHSTAEYVMFCDVDDIFFSACGIWVALRDLDAEKPDTYVSTFVEETRASDTGKVAYLVHGSDDCTFVHGKIHRRQYLIDEGIRWNEALTVHEDSYFNILCQTLTEKVLRCPAAFYLWRYRQDSLCRHDPKYLLKTYHNLIDSGDALIEEFKRRGRDDRVTFYAVTSVLDAYYTMNKPEWINQENQAYRDGTERHFAAFFAKYKDVWEASGDKEKMIASNHIRANKLREGMAMENITIADWLKHIETLTA